MSPELLPPGVPPRPMPWCMRRHEQGCFLNRPSASRWRSACWSTRWLMPIRKNRASGFSSGRVTPSGSGCFEGPESIRSSGARAVELQIFSYNSLVVHSAAAHRSQGRYCMEIDEDKVYDAVLALLYLT